MQLKEYGGYLPLEIKRGREYYQLPDQDIRYYNCGKTAIYAACKEFQASEIYVPYYICQSVVDTIEETGMKVLRYYVNQRLQPDCVFPKNAVIYFVNYFGLKNELMHTLAAQYETVIIDNTQAFFCPPVMREGISNIYSCRKFVGVPDGGYLIEKNCKAKQLPFGSSWSHYSFICKSRELGTNAAYQQSLENESRLDRKEGMSILTKDFLGGVDYENIMETRIKNYRKLDNILTEKNRLRLPLNGGVPYAYPYWAQRGHGEYIRSKLLERRIYTPTLWRECITACPQETLEHQWSKDLISIPVDQRYREDDMCYLAETILEIEGQI